eukprot:2907959-Pleurochrysis_carterae.AAC.1
MKLENGKPPLLSSDFAVPINQSHERTCQAMSPQCQYTGQLARMLAYKIVTTQVQEECPHSEVTPMA